MLLGEWLRPHGFDVLTTRDASNLGLSDDAQLRFATERQRALLTHNRIDFERLHRAAIDGHASHAGIIIANRRASHADVARRIMKLLNFFTADAIKNQLLYL
ncbi:DUF5615 family PIN-like protein [Nitrospira sp. BLG_2]|uniref:DUF5615 family PIN-like protein n=1 Tax=Nitrospira sp. BLG_2 TaxID=3397507 RepID=UPI003B997497